MVDLGVGAGGNSVMSIRNLPNVPLEYVGRVWPHILGPFLNEFFSIHH